MHIPWRNPISEARFQRPALVLLSALWGLAAVLVAGAFVASQFAAHPAPGVAPPAKATKNVESVTRSSMLREPRLAISKNKLD